MTGCICFIKTNRIFIFFNGIKNAKLEKNMYIEIKNAQFLNV